MEVVAVEEEEEVFLEVEAVISGRTITCHP